MILRLYLFSLYLTLFLSAGLIVFIIFNINPNQSPFWMVFIFYLTLFLFWAAFWGLIGFYLKVYATNREIIFAHLVPTIRQSMLIALAMVGLLFLQQMRVLNWWVAILFILAVSMIELFFRSRKTNLRKSI